ncbi:MAG: xanthine dehydrogenase family protein subunit M [Rhodospirillaceae bacterium]|nr:xanthine dehydrogenase family protein subunit M [Rhodospirillaceae bacterium]MDD9914469.1 xanthine dehydrogenase family protein subunit M [Rhodospirillaceae bacterium]MDD9928676.1 xanthine dehydrogenase family protein subunit M [Rhodospirillaceae bacterium]
MNGMRYEAPSSVDEASALLAGASGEARVLAGGTDLLVQLRSGMVAPELVVDVKNIEEMMTYSVNDGAYTIGAAVPSAQLHEDADLLGMWTGVVEAMDLVGSTQIQGRASLGGNLCNASPAADSVPAMIAAGAICNVAGPNGRREVPVEDICTGPGQTSLAKGEIVVSISLPKQAPRTGDAYLRFIPRTEMDIAVVGAGVCLSLDDSGTCTDARVSLGAVAPTALLVKECADALIGTKVDDAAMANLDAAARAAASPIDDKRGTVEFRTKVSGVLARRAAAIALERAGS